MEYEKIKQLMEDMGNSKLTSIDIDFPDGTKISIKKENKEIVKVVETQNPVSNIESNITKEEETTNTLNTTNNIEEGNIVKSPMVGTFYLKPAPNADPYVKIGQKVKKEDILCIIEAMKLMNEIENEFDGEVAEILAKDGEPVEYGTPLFRIK